MDSDCCPHEGVEILDEDWWYCRDCGDAGPYLVPIRRAEHLPVLAYEDYDDGYGDALTSRDKRRYHCPTAAMRCTGASHGHVEPSADRMPSPRVIETAKAPAA
ncbi:hypothetical protein ACQPXS_37625 [Streptomyces sp. CA-142005]|uniref:hypothetical protein n=1 Tax=Streptomyces sp. CA-142005 TaxID=3240052 RepID=UPI003D8D40E6